MQRPNKYLINNEHALSACYSRSPSRAVSTPSTLASLLSKRARERIICRAADKTRRMANTRVRGAQMMIQNASNEGKPSPPMKNRHLRIRGVLPPPHPHRVKFQIDYDTHVLADRSSGSMAISRSPSSRWNSQRQVVGSRERSVDARARLADRSYVDSRDWRVRFTRRRAN